MIIEILRQIYGDDVFNILLKITFEFATYFMFGVFGGIIREYFTEKDKCISKIFRIIVGGIITATILFIFGNVIKNANVDTRLVFGLGVFVAIYLPNLKNSIKNGKIFKHIIGFFSDKLGKMLKDIEDEK